MSNVQTLDPLSLPLTSSRLIEASAGTGKTFTLALLYVRLVLGHREPGQPLEEELMPPGILVVTFTEAATKELRDRIRARLTEAAALFGEAPESVDTEAALKDPLIALRNSRPKDEWPACQRKLLLAAEWMDEAAVSTIHGWCNRMLSEHAFDSGSLFRQTLETDQTELLDEVTRDYWRTFVYPTPEEHIDKVLAAWNTPKALRGSVRNLLSKIDALSGQPLPPAEAVAQAEEEQRAKLDALKADWVGWCEELTDLLESTTKPKKKPLHGTTKKTIQTAVNVLRDWATSDEVAPRGLLNSSLKGYSYLEAETFAEQWKGEEPAPQHPAMDAIKELKEALANLPSPKPAMLNHAVRWIAQRLTQEKQRLAQMGFDDLLTRLDEALHGDQGERLAQTIRQQFPVAMIDEFQDTDPVQYRIFDRVYRIAENRPDTTLLMIGDPKQAIYAFRGADIYTYLDARQAVSDRTYTLGTNFRSSKAMVSGVNRFFSHADAARTSGAFLFRSGDQNPLPFVSVNAKGTDRQWQVRGQAAPALTFWTLGEEDDVKKGEGRTQLAEACASEIVRLLNLGQQGQAGFRLESASENALESEFQSLKPEHIAVLVNKRDEADAVRQSLSARGVRSVYLSDRNSVLHSPIAGELLQWLMACAEPGQLSLLRGALATPSLALSHQDLDQLLSDENALDREIDRFVQYRALWQNQGVLPMLRRFLMDFGVPAKLLAWQDGERLLTDILHLAELLQQDSQQLDGEHALIHHFTELLQQSEDEAEHRSMRLESDAGLVKVVTVHKSKGLEYPLVFLPFATEHRQPNPNQDFITYHDEQGQLQVALESSPETVQKANHERLGEDIRKLYVALTRARYATWVGAPGIKNWAASGLGYLISEPSDIPAADLTPWLTALAEGHPSIAIQSAPEPGTEDYLGEPEPPLGNAREPVRDARENWWIASYSAITFGALSGFGDDFQPASEDAEQENLRTEAEPEATDQPDPTTSRVVAEKQHGFPRGAGPGTFLHDILEWCAERGFKTVADNPQPLYDLLVRRCQLRHWDDWVDILYRWVLQLITVEFPLPDTEQSVSLAGLSVAKAEMEFWFESHQVNTLTMDRLVRTGTLEGEPRPEAHEATFNGMLKGFIDLVFEHEGRYYVLDYKSNALGDGDGAYVPEAMKAKILEARYDLQYVIYLLALHRLLKARLPDYDYDTHVGGAVYLFLRGCDAPGAGAFTERPGKALIESLDRLFSGQKESAA